jgi:pimeloyl-ACP methyl ester carboxylesterase
MIVIIKLLLVISFLKPGIQLQKQTSLTAEIVQPEEKDSIFFKSETIDFIRIKSTVTDSVQFAVAIFKPVKPSPVLLISHGWHGEISMPKPGSESVFPGFLAIHVDMRGRKYSTGNPDCNGYELYDFYDTYKYAIKNYSQYISDPGQVYFYGESGGGGNGFAILGKFPDLFCSAMIYCGISDYNLWYKDDTIGEFRDEMLPWIKSSPDQNPEAYASRSGITTAFNLLTPAYIVHGETDIRVPSYHSRNFFNKARDMNKKVEYLELKGVGTRDHYGNITEKQKLEVEQFKAKGLSKHPVPVLLQKGKFIVAGYLVTKYFTVFLDSIDKVAEIEYNIKKKSVKFISGKGTVTWN